MQDQLKRSYDGNHVTAILRTYCGDLLIFDTEAIDKVVGALPQVLPSLTSASCYDPPAPPPPVELVDGFTITQWSTYAKLKASIASRVCQENGALKKQLASLCRTDDKDLSDKLYEQDPWRTPNADKVDQECDTVSSASAYSTAALNAWSKWRAAPETTTTDVASIGEDTGAAAVELAVADTEDVGESPIVVPSVTRCDPRTDPDTHAMLDESFYESSKDDTEDIATTCAAIRSPIRYPNHDLDNIESDIPGKSWDRKDVCKLWNKMIDDDASDLVASWLKDRYSRKHGIQNMKNMDKTIAALSNIELNALTNFCKTADHKFLDIPIYKVRFPASSDTKVDCTKVEEVTCNSPASAAHNPDGSNTVSSKLAGISKRGMAQPRNRR